MVRENRIIVSTSYPSASYGWWYLPNTGSAASPTRYTVGPVQESVWGTHGAATLSTWNHVVFQETTDLAELWFNGTKVSSVSRAITDVELGIRQEGPDWSSGQFWFGEQQDEIRIYDRWLTDDEIAYLYSNGL